MLAACDVLKSHLSDSKAVTNKDLVRNLISCLLNDVMKRGLERSADQSPRWIQCDTPTVLPELGLLLNLPVGVLMVTSCLCREAVSTRCSTSGSACPARRRRWRPWWRTTWELSRTSLPPCCATSSTWPTATATRRCTTAFHTQTSRW